VNYVFAQVITSLPPPDSGSDLHFHTLDEQLDLLSKVLLNPYFTAVP